MPRIPKNDALTGSGPGNIDGPWEISTWRLWRGLGLRLVGQGGRGHPQALLLLQILGFVEPYCADITSEEVRHQRSY